MEIYILDSNYEKIGYIDSAESVLWNKKLNDVGECELYLPAEKDYIHLIMDGKYIYREDDDMICEIKTVELETDVENGDYIIVTGHDLKNLLGGRIVKSEITYSGKVCNFIKKLIVDNIINPSQSNRSISNFTFNDSNFSEFQETISVNAFTEDLLEVIKTTCKTFNYGFRVKYISDTKTLEFELFKGVNKARVTSDTYVEFSHEYSNIISSRYKEDNSNYKNVCYVGYKDEKEVFQLMSVFNTFTEPTGENRKEIYIDGSSTSRELTKEALFEMFPKATLIGSEYVIYIGDGSIVGPSLMTVVATVDSSGEEEKIIATDYTYELLLRTLALNTLASYVKVTEFEGEVDTIDTYDYKIDYDLGDVVKVINEYGIAAEAIITEIMESDDNENGYVVEPKFEYTN